MDVDVIVKTFLRPLALARLLRSIARYYPDARVTVADDGGLRQGADVNSRRACAYIDAHPQIRLLELPFNSGVSAGRNHLIRSTHAPFVLLLDDDYRFTEATRVERLVGALESDPRVGVAAGLLLDVYKGRRYPRHVEGTLDTVGDSLVHRVGAWRDPERRICDYVSNFFVARREVFDSVAWRGGIGGEHYDFFMQLRATPWQVHHDASVTIDHHRTTPALPGYRAYRQACDEAQLAFLRRWGVRSLFMATLVCSRVSTAP